MKRIGLLTGGADVILIPEIPYDIYSEFQRAAEKVKPDVCLDGSGCDPRFENIMAMNRLHDIQNVYEERELRAEASAFFMG